jgi:hypothetical protein
MRQSRTPGATVKLTLTAARSHTFRLKQRPDIGAFVAADLMAPPDHRASRAAIGIAELLWQLPVE